MKLVHVNAHSSGGRRVKAYTQRRGGGSWKPPRRQSVLAPVGTPWKPTIRANSSPDVGVGTPRRRVSGSVARRRTRTRGLTTGRN